MGWLWIALMGLAVVVLVLAEWPRLSARLPVRADRPRARRRRRTDHLRVVPNEPLDDSDDFAASVERDLARLPTIQDRD